MARLPPSAAIASNLARKSTSFLSADNERSAYVQRTYVRAEGEGEITLLQVPRALALLPLRLLFQPNPGQRLLLDLLPPVLIDHTLRTLDSPLQPLYLLCPLLAQVVRGRSEELAGVLEAGLERGQLLGVHARQK